MRVCVLGAGAIGGYLGTRLAAAGVPTPAIDALYGLTRLWTRCHLQFVRP
jgi:predicted dinucleotide-binding enzyme